MGSDVVTADRMPAKEPQPLRLASGELGGIDGDSEVATAGSAAPQIIVTGRRLPTDANGNQLTARANGEAPGASEAYHPQLNNDQYNDAVIAAFDEVTTLDGAIDALARIRSKLQVADFPGVRPRPEKGTPK